MLLWHGSEETLIGEHFLWISLLDTVVRLLLFSLLLSETDFADFGQTWGWLRLLSTLELEKEGTLHLEGTRARQPKIVPLTLDVAGQGNHGVGGGDWKISRIPAVQGFMIKLTVWMENECSCGARHQLENVSNWCARFQVWPLALQHQGLMWSQHCRHWV